MVRSLLTAALMILALLASATASAGEVLYNGIELTDPCPPSNVSLSRTPPPAPDYLQHPPAVIRIDVGRQLFVDNFLIEHTTLTKKFHAATLHRNPVLVPDKPWEYTTLNYTRPKLAIPFSDGVWYDPKDKLHKMWYQAGFNGATAYAQSTDGVHWTKPSLDVVKGTNMVYLPLHDSTTVWLDQETTDAAQRYKMTCYDWPASEKVLVFYSADGIHWGNPVAAREKTVGDRTTCFYNPFRKVWVLSERDVKSYPKLGRVRRYAEGTTLAAAAQAASVPWVCADDLDPPRPDIRQATQLYNLDAVAYESVIVGLFSVLRGYPTNYPARDKINNIVAGFSRDGFHWDRSNRSPIVDVSEDPHAWNYSNVQSVGGCFLVEGDRLFFYVSGRQTMDTTVHPGVVSTGLATMRRDGFASLDASDREGTLLTRPVVFSGKRLFVNVDAAQGMLRAEVLDQQDRVIDPFTRANCEPIAADKTRTQVRWTGAADLSALSRTPVKFRFWLRNGSLYAFWVSPDASGASHGYVAAGGPGLTGPTDTVGDLDPPN